MKRLSILVIIIISFLSGCSNKLPLKGVTERPHVGICTVENLSDSLELWCEVWDSSAGNETNLTKDNLIICILPSAKDNKTFTSYYDSQDDFYNWHRNLLSEIIEANTSYLVQEYLYAGVGSGARICADKVIFGREPGVDLGDMFKPQFSRFLTYHYVASYPEYNLLYDLKVHQPETFREFMNCSPSLGTYGFLCLKFTNVPQEELQTITFSVELPVEYQYYKKYEELDYNEQGILPPGQRILKGSITVEFGKIVHTTKAMIY